MMPVSWPFGRRPVEEAAQQLYAAAVLQARHPVFYAELAVEDSVDGRFDLIALHVFLLLNRLGQGGRGLRRLGQALFDLMFADMDESLRELGVSDMAVGGRVKAMARAFYGRVAAYEPGLEDSMLLEQALARNLYRGAPVDPTSLSVMASYVQRQVGDLAGYELADFKEGRVRFDAPVVP